MGINDRRSIDKQVGPDYPFREENVRSGQGWVPKASPEEFLLRQGHARFFLSHLLRPVTDMWVISRNYWSQRLAPDEDVKKRRSLRCVSYVSIHGF